MTHAVRIGDVEIEQIVYHDQPVATFEQIAAAHKISVKNVHQAFRRNRQKFTEGKHYFRLDFTEAIKLLFPREVSRNGLLLFTRQGYALLTKPMRDPKAWEVQERMIDEYFTMQEHLEALPEPEVPLPPPDAERPEPPRLRRVPLLPGQHPLARAVDIATQYRELTETWGVPEYLTQREACYKIHRETGEDLSGLLRYAPAQIEAAQAPSDPDPFLEPTSLARACGIGDAQTMNLYLETIGWQTKSEQGVWTPTVEGAPHAQHYAWIRAYGKSGKNLRWRLRAVKAQVAARVETPEDVVPVPPAYTR